MNVSRILAIGLSMLFIVAFLSRIVLLLKRFPSYRRDQTSAASISDPQKSRGRWLGVECAWPDPLVSRERLPVL
jgi:hypothetical protein